MAPPRVSILGPLLVEVDGKREEIGVGPIASLLGYLAFSCADGRWVDRTRLLDTLWPDLPEDRARRTLNTALRRLREHLGPFADCLISQGETIRLSGIDIDVAEFRDFAHSQASDEQRAAVDRYRGDLLEALDDEWVAEPRAALRREFLRLLERLCREATRSGALHDALVLAERWIRADPYNELACRTAMRLAARLGRRADAIAWFRRLENVLADEVDIAPSPGTRALADAIRDEVMAVAPVDLASPFVGRRAERSALIELVERAMRGDGNLVLLEGEPGIGKTRLLERVADSAQWRGVAVAWGHARPLEERSVFQPLLEAVRSLLTPVRIDVIRDHLPPPALNALGGLLPALTADRPPGGEASDAMVALADLVQSVGAVTTAVLILDDVQWAGPGFWDVLAELAPAVRQNRLLIVVSYRDHELRADAEAWDRLSAIEREHDLYRLRLGGLTEPEIAELVGLLGATANVPALAERTGGNPLFVRESLHVSPAAAETLNDLVDRQVASLPEHAKESLRMAAVLGRTLDYTQWRRAAGVELRDALPALVAGRWIEEEETGFRFRHDLVRERVYESIEPALRPALHARVAEALGDECDPAILAWHLERAEDWEQAALAYGRAGDQALHHALYAVALGYFDRAIGLGGRVPNSDRLRLGLLCQRQEALGRTMRTAEWVADLNEIERLANALDDRSARFVAAEARTKIAFLAMDPGAMVTLSETAANLARELGDRAGEARIARGLGVIGPLDLRYLTRMRVIIDRGVAAAEQLADPFLLYSLLCMLAQHQQYGGQAQAAFATATRALALADTQPALAAVRLEALCRIGCALIFAGDWQAGRDKVAEAAAEIREDTSFWQSTPVILNYAMVAAYTGRHDEARRSIHAIVDSARSLGPAVDPGLILFVEIFLFEIIVISGDLETAERLEPVFLNLPDSVPPLARNYALTALGQLRLLQGRPAEALDLLTPALDLTIGSEFDRPTRLLRIVALVETGDLPAAHAALAEVDALFATTDTRHWHVLLHWVRHLVHGTPEHLTAAQQEIDRQAGLMTDTELRQAFVENVLLHRQIADRIRALRQEQVAVVRLARSDAPLGRALRPEDLVQVRWTIDAGPDDLTILSEQGAAGLRRHRLQRLIREAQSQNAAPTDEDLAAALGVSTRTVRRDSQALRAQKVDLDTRRRLHEHR